MKRNDEVSWHRGDLPRGKGKIVETKEISEGKHIHMVRDPRTNQVFGLPEHKLTHEVL